MKIRAVANGNVIHADDEAAKQLIEAGIYEAYDEKAEPKANSTQPPPVEPATSPTPRPRQAKGRKTR